MTSPVGIFEGQRGRVIIIRQLEPHAHARGVIGSPGVRRLAIAATKSYGWMRLKKAQGIGLNRVFKGLPKHIQIIQNPEAPTLCCND